MKKGRTNGENANSLVTVVGDFVTCTSGLRMDFKEDAGVIEIYQTADDRRLEFRAEEIKEVLPREDKEGKSFIQVNFVSGIKILLTDSLIGFKPLPQRGLDLDRLPKVVTTPDLLSVFEAIEEALNTEPSIEDEVDLLRKVYHAILEGGEAAGFNLQPERVWLSRLTWNAAASA